MQLLKSLYFFSFFICLFAVLLYSSGCSKEYSFERGPVDSVIVNVPDTVVSTQFLPSCYACKSMDIKEDSTWNFQIDGTVLCGKAEKALISIEKTAFTFFGPSTCSADSGFIISVYLNEALDSDKTNISAPGIAFYYYDRVKPSYVLISRPGEPFSFTIEKYVHETGFATGSFSGYVYTESGIKKLVSGGKFKIKFK
jgi:hypothetical protein